MTEPAGSLYCISCDLIYDEPVEACPQCEGGVVAWDDRYLREDPRKGSMKQGVVLLLCLHMLQLIALLLPNGTEVFMLFGFTQLLYALPAFIVLAAKGRTRSMGGLAIAAVITLAVNLAVLGFAAMQFFEGYD